MMPITLTTINYYLQDLVICSKFVNFLLCVLQGAKDQGKTRKNLGYSDSNWWPSGVVL